MSKDGNLQAREFLIFNPMLYSDLDKYIWISDSSKVHSETQRFFVCMLKKGIYIKGFATDKKSMVGLRMFNKKIYDINVLDKKKSVVFYDTYMLHYDVELLEGLHNARLLNPDMPKENVVIWGSGVTGRRVYRILSENGVKAKCYVDVNKELEGTYQCGLPVYTPQYLEKTSVQPIIIEAMEKWEKLDESIRAVFEQRFYFSFIEREEIVCNDISVKLLFDLKNWWVNFPFFIGKKVYVYGIGEVEKRFAEYLRLLDIDWRGWLIDESFEIVDDSIYDENDVKYIEEVLHEEDYFIWVFDKRKVKKLEELGVVSHKNYICYHGANNTLLKRKQILDTNLGHNYCGGADGSRYPGIMVYGNEQKKDLKIAVLGNSTTDGTLYPFKSWPELMYEELYSRDLTNVTVYNGGVVAYTSGQELLKLIRDVIPLNPDMVVVYDGFTDLDMHFSYPLTGGYLRKIFEFARENMGKDDDCLFDGKNTVVCRGIEAKKDMFDAWLANIRIMYAIAKEHNIRFYSFCQPMLASKEGKTEVEKNMLLSVYSPIITNLLEGNFRERMHRMNKLPEYMYDFSHIFDNKEVYMDHCHVWEEGNQIIASEITKIILPELRKMKGGGENLYAYSIFG